MKNFYTKNGIKTVRLAIIGAVTNLIINDQVIYQEDFDQDFRGNLSKNTH